MIAIWNEFNLYEEHWLPFKDAVPLAAQLFKTFTLTSTGPHAKRIMPELLKAWPHWTKNNRPRVVLFLKPGTIGWAEPSQANGWQMFRDYCALHAPGCDVGIDAETWITGWDPTDEQLAAFTAGLRDTAAAVGRVFMYGPGLWPGAMYARMKRIFLGVFGKPIPTALVHDGQFARPELRPEQLVVAKEAARICGVQMYSKLNVGPTGANKNRTQYMRVWEPKDVRDGLAAKRWTPPVCLYGAGRQFIEDYSKLEVA